MTQTGKLRAAIKQEIEGYTCKVCDKCADAISSQVLEICADMGLKFTRTGIRGDDIEGSCLCKIEEIEI